MNAHVCKDAGAVGLGDVIVRLDGRAISDEEDLLKALEGCGRRLQNAAGHRRAAATSGGLAVAANNAAAA